MAVYSRLSTPGLWYVPSEKEYEEALVNFTQRLLKTGSKLLFVSTSPFMPDHYYGNLVVEDLNAIAQKVMATYNIPYADTYHHITAYCGDNYTSCDICDNETTQWPPSAPPGRTCCARMRRHLALWALT